MKLRIQNALERIPAIPRYILTAFVPCLVITAGVVALLFAVLSVFGIYTELENALDLKASSPWVTVPLYASIGGTIICFLAGSLMYFHKYKRAVNKTKFYRGISEVYAREHGSEKTH